LGVQVFPRPERNQRHQRGETGKNSPRGAVNRPQADGGDICRKRRAYERPYAKERRGCGRVRGDPGKERSEHYPLQNDQGGKTRGSGAVSVWHGFLQKRNGVYGCK
jgi:hypothetical protein